MELPNTTGINPVKKLINQLLVKFCVLLTLEQCVFNEWSMFCPCFSATSPNPYRLVLYFLLMSHFLFLTKFSVPCCQVL